MTNDEEQIVDFVLRRTDSKGAIVLCIDPHGCGKVVMQQALEGCTSLQMAALLEQAREVLGQLAEVYRAN